MGIFEYNIFFKIQSNIKPINKSKNNMLYYKHEKII